MRCKDIKILASAVYYLNGKSKLFNPVLVMKATISDSAAVKTRGFRRHGPISVQDDNLISGVLKLFSFCKRSFPSLSKKALQDCFLAGCIFVNQERIRCGHDDESRRLFPGDVVEIKIDLDAADAAAVEATELNVLHTQDGFAIITKVSGVSAAFDKDLDKALKSKLWGGRRKGECQLLYHLEKGFSGICVVAETAESLLQLRALSCVDRSTEFDGSYSCETRSIDTTEGLVTVGGIHKDQKPFLELIHRCIVCGKVGEVDEVVFLDTGHKAYPIIEAKVMRYARCRSKGYISMIDIRVTFDAPHMGIISDSEEQNGCDVDWETESVGAFEGESEEEGEEGERSTGRNEDIQIPEEKSNEKFQGLTVENVRKPTTAADYRYLHYPTVRLRTIKRALSLCGHQIVGDGGAVKSAKGIFAAIVSVTIYNPSHDTENIPQECAVSPDDAAANTSERQHAPHTFTVPDPDKFAKLMFKEQEMWERAENRDIEILHAWEKITDSSQPLSPIGEVDIGVNLNLLMNNVDGSSSPLSLEQMRAAMGTGMPVEYILGKALFCGYDFTVSKEVMVPRKSSEVLVNQAVCILNDLIIPAKRSHYTVNSTHPKAANSSSGHNSSSSDAVCGDDVENSVAVSGDNDDFPSVRILDIGTGSGCLLLSCMQALKGKQMQLDKSVDRHGIRLYGLGIDISEGALQIAAKNATSLQLEENVDFTILDFKDLIALVPGSTEAVQTSLNDEVDSGRICDVENKVSGDETREVEELHNAHVSETHGEFLPSTMHGPFDVILCNPPYSSRRDTTRLSVACREHEPSLALFSPDGPLAAYRTLAASLTAAENLRKRQLSLGLTATGFFSNNAYLLLEVGHGQDVLVKKIFSKLDFLSFFMGVKDHKGIDRCLVYEYRSEC